MDWVNILRITHLEPSSDRRLMRRNVAARPLRSSAPPYAASAVHQTFRGTDIMRTTIAARALVAALIGALLAGAPKFAFADIQDYEFQLVEPIVQAGADKIVTIRLINKKTGKPVPDAVIFATRLDMAPDGMQEMATKVTPMPGTEPGTYRFKANFSMAGRWQLSLGAKVQGETGTVENKLVVTAQK
jgi:hypothetical protein